MFVCGMCACWMFMYVFTYNVCVSMYALCIHDCVQHAQEVLQITTVCIQIYKARNFRNPKSLQFHFQGSLVINP